MVNLSLLAIFLFGYFVIMAKKMNDKNVMILNLIKGCTSKHLYGLFNQNKQIGFINWA